MASVTMKKPAPTASEPIDLIASPARQAARDASDVFISV
jgi:hypothetical protein